MEINIDPNSGFCFGVVFAIQMAEDELEKSPELYCLGDIVHNNKEIERLSAKGLKIIDHEQLKELRNCKVLIRAHGEPPETYKIAIENNIELIDASCPVVLKLQNRVRASYDEVSIESGQVVIYGEAGHAEVNGLLGQTDGKAILVSSEKDLHKIDFTMPVYFFSQTTKSSEGFYSMKTLVEEKILEVQGEEGVKKFVAHDTLCRQVSNREPHLKKFASQHDILVFVSGKKSSNGKALYEACKSINSKSYFISEPADLQREWFKKEDKVGISGATSTPAWLMKEVADKIQSIV